MKVETTRLSKANSVAKLWWTVATSPEVELSDARERSELDLTTLPTLADAYRDMLQVTVRNHTPLHFLRFSEQPKHKRVERTKAGLQTHVSDYLILVYFVREYFHSAICHGNELWMLSILAQVARRGRNCGASYYFDVDTQLAGLEPTGYQSVHSIFARLNWSLQDLRTDGVPADPQHSSILLRTIFS